MSKERLQAVHENIVGLLERSVEDMTQRDILTDNDVKKLEILNKILTVCQNRKEVQASSGFEKLSDEELESSF